MSLSLLALITHIPTAEKLYTDAAKFVTDAKALKADTSLQKIIAANPALAKDAVELSVPWRTLEGDEIDLVRDKNLGSKLHDLEKGSVDFNRLATAFKAVVSDPAVATFISTTADPALTDLVTLYSDIRAAFAVFGVVLPVL